MFFEWINEGRVWESCTSYAIIRVITGRVIRNFELDDVFFLNGETNGESGRVVRVMR